MKSAKKNILDQSSSTKQTKEEGEDRPLSANQINKTEKDYPPSANQINKTEKDQPLSVNQINKTQKDQPLNTNQINKTQKDQPLSANQINTTKEKTYNSEITKILNPNDEEENTLLMQINSTKETPASLLLLNGPKDLVGLSWPLNNSVTKIGRSRNLNDIPIHSKKISKTHFRILNEKTSFYIVDLRSTNKTYLNDQLVLPYEKTTLENNSYIQAGDLIFKFLDKGNIELFSSLQMLRKTQTDSLTGAGNRHLLEIKGNEYFLSNQPLSLIVFDIDNFKSINDSLGHTAGDYILRTLAAYIMKLIRKGDMFIRYGGDEFCNIYTQQFVYSGQYCLSD